MCILTVHIFFAPSNNYRPSTGTSFLHKSAQNHKSDRNHRLNGIHMLTVHNISKTGCVPTAHGIHDDGE